MLKRLLDTDPGDQPGPFSAEVRAVFDVSRRDPDVAFDQGLTLWSCRSNSPAVVAEISFHDITARAGGLVVVTRMDARLSADAWIATLGNTGLTGPGAQPVFTRDLRGSAGLAVEAGLLVQADSAVAGAGGNVFYNTVGIAGPGPVVLVDVGNANHLQVGHTVLNTQFQLNLEGFTLRRP